MTETGHATDHRSSVKLVKCLAAAGRVGELVRPSTREQFIRGHVTREAGKVHTGNLAGQETRQDCGV